MAAVDLAALYRLQRNRTPWEWLRVCILAGTVAAVLAFALGSSSFGIAGLAADGIFVHGVLVQAGGALFLRKTARKTAIVSAAGALVFAAVAVDTFWIEPTWLEVTRVRLTSAKLSRPVRIVVVADFQADSFGDYEHEVLRRAMEEKPDLLLLAGDYFQVEPSTEARLRVEVNAYLRELGFAAPLGTYAVQGNVDSPYWPELFEGLQVTAVDQTESFDLGPLRLTCLGWWDSFHWRLAVPNARPEQYHIVLGHSPNFALGRIEADLLVAGHTHGGQVRLPWIGPVIRHTLVPQRWAVGLSELPSGALLYVSRGLGMEREDAPRLRFLCRPELVVIELEPESRPAHPAGSQ